MAILSPFLSLGMTFHDERIGGDGKYTIAAIDG